MQSKFLNTKRLIVLFVFIVSLTTSMNSQEVGKIFDAAQYNIFYETAKYILDADQEKVEQEQLNDKMDFETQLINLKTLNNTVAHNCIMYSKYPNSSEKDSDGYLKKASGSIITKGENIDKDVEALNNIKENVLSFLNNEVDGMLEEGNYKENLDRLKNEIDAIIKDAEGRAKQYVEPTIEFENSDKIRVDTSTTGSEFVKNDNVEERKQETGAVIDEKKVTDSISDNSSNKEGSESKETAVKKEETKPNYSVYILSFLAIVILGFLLFENIKTRRKLKAVNEEIDRIKAENSKLQVAQKDTELASKKSVSKTDTDTGATSTTDTNTKVIADTNIDKKANSTTATNTVKHADTATNSNIDSDTITENKEEIIAHSQKKTESETKPIDLSNEIKSDWTIVGASVIGKSHIEMNKPCQDSHIHLMLNDKWGIAITSDGAGSAKHSDIGSKAVVKMASTIVFKKILEDNKWHVTNKLPSQSEWEEIAKKGMLEIYSGLKQYAAKNNYVLTDLACTIIVTIFSPIGLLVTHIGDGRAGYRTIDGAWKASITPHSGEESNQTIFITSSPWIANDSFEMSGVSVPESRVINEKISAFISMTDGAEAHLFESSKIDPITHKWTDPNRPALLFEKHIKTILDNKNSNVSIEEISKMWVNYITEGNVKIANEPDDKTVILGILS